jgi:hypothetical protein
MVVGRASQARSIIGNPGKRWNNAIGEALCDCFSWLKALLRLL